MEHQQIDSNFANHIKEAAGLQEVKAPQELANVLAEQRQASAAVLRWPHPVLKKPCQPVDQINADVLAQIDKMIGVMKALNGVGIAANQLGYTNRIFIGWFNAREDKDIVTMINPMLHPIAAPWKQMKEACLSGDGCVGTINRRTACFVSWLDVNGIPRSQSFTDWNARIVQHEMDHLNGICIIDKFNAADKLMNRNEIELLRFQQTKELPDRLKKKGYVSKTTH